MLLEIRVDKPYDFQGSVRNHGWVGLAPFTWISEGKALQRVERLENGSVVLIRLTSADAGRQVRVLVDVGKKGPTSVQEQEEIRRKVRWMLRLDEDLSDFYQLCSGEQLLQKKVVNGRGRLLRSPSLFEDIVKTICTTNTTWSQTVGMARRLVGCLGDQFPLDPA